jgi:large subunit ribosomal protein L10
VNRSDKQKVVESLAEELKAGPAIFAVDYRGLKVEQANALRRRIREQGSRYQVVKNTLTLRAIRGTPLEPLAGQLKGMTGLAYTSNDPVALAKLIASFAKEVPALAFKGGVVSGRPVAAGQLDQLASLPGRAELLGKLLFVLQAPIQNLLGVLQAPARDLVLVLQAAADKAQAPGGSQP